MSEVRYPTGRKVQFDFNLPNRQVKRKITDWVDPKDKTGEFKRGTSKFRDTISTESGARYPPEKGRYHLYVSYACPWAHRTLITRNLKGLQDYIGITSVHWEMLEKGWRFAKKDEIPGDNAGPDPIHPNFTHLQDIYYESEPNYEGRFTVPVLYDTKTKRIVNNESSEIIRMLYHGFDSLLPPDSHARNLDLYPESLRSEIESTNEWTYNDINNGVYKSGFATSQEAYERNVVTLFKSLDRVESHLRTQFSSPKSPGPYYLGPHLTELDIRLFTTIIRFDPVYVQHFKCNLKDIRSGYPAIHRWMKYLYWNVPAFKETTQFEHIKKHYTKSHIQINPFSITPVGPIPDILPESTEVEAVEAAVEKAKDGK
ncbi:putative cell wall biogenesis protein glutathione transferase [Phaeomoniella chlamydospora]|uniref:Glutathione S-transferase omega-like 2 n=1 Tax=Phaeomoniella chlamydospora TaxID=158046 RepID=A0A0G2GT30_PHACM|nr:putative cell wall biogenesis protein glutathione transferase [Phaeomoniella chlamydospora]